MTRNSLTAATERIETAKRSAADPDVRDRLERLADQLQSQAERETTPALGALDRIHAKLREIEDRTDDATAEAAIERARQDIMSFLETLDDRGMTQHG